MIMNLTMIKSLITTKEEYSEPKTIEMLSSIPFISSFIRKNGKEYLPQLLTLSSMKTLNEGKSIDLTHSIDHILIYLSGALGLFNHQEELSSEHISFGLPVMITSKQRLCDKIELKIMTRCSFISINRKEYESLLEVISIEKTQKITKFTSTIKIFKLFYNIKKNLYEKLYQISQERSYKRKEIVFEENSEVDGIYLIIKGSFLLTKRQPNETKLEELKKIDQELKYLSKEGDLYLKCLNNKFSSGSREIREMKQKLNLLGGHTSLNSNLSLGSSQNKTLITKSQSPIMNVTILADTNLFGDIELISKEKTRSYSIKCISEIGNVIYFPHEKFKEICTESMLEKIHIEVLKKTNLFSQKYFSDIKIAEGKLLLERYSKIPVDINKIKVKRNFFEEMWREKEVKTAFKTFKMSCVNFRLPNVNRENITCNSMNKKHDTNKEESGFSHLKLNSAHHDASLVLKKKFDKIESEMQMMSNTNYNVLQTDNNQTPSTRIQNTFVHNPTFMKQTYKETGIKYPNSLSKNKKKMSFHFKNNGCNLKKMLIKNNLSDVELILQK